MIFTLRQLQEKVREQHSSMFDIFVDLWKAFDMVNRQVLCEILLRFGCPSKLVNIIADLHMDNGAQVIAGGDINGFFNISNGVRQGCVLAPVIFNIFATSCVSLQDRGIVIRYRFDNGLQ